MKTTLLTGIAALLCIIILWIVAELRPDRPVYFIGKEAPCDVPASPFNAMIDNRCHEQTEPDKQ